MKNLTVPKKEEVSLDNQTIFENLEKAIGFVPNLFATFAHSESALRNYLNLQNGKTSLNSKQREVVNLVVSQINKCEYCLSAHTQIAKLNGFSDSQIIEIRQAEITFDSKLNALAKLVKSITENRGNTSEKTIDNFYNQGFNHENLIDVVMAIGDKIISNYMHALTQVPIDFPMAANLESVEA